MDTQTETTATEHNPEEVRRRNRSEYGKQWRQANKERKKEYQKGWAKQRKLLEANAIRITEDEFIALLEARKSIMDTAKGMIGAGFNVNSKFCDSLYDAAEKIEKTLAKRIGIKSWECMPNDYSSLEWALEYLDKGEPAVITFENQQLVVKIYNYKQLFRTLMEEAEQQRADDRANQPSNGKKKKPAAKEKSKENSVDNTGELFRCFFD